MTGSANIAVLIDTVAPTCEVAYSTTGMTNQPVIASLTNCSKPILTGTDNGMYIFTDNGNYIFHFTDLLGNAGSVEASVSWIDKIPLIASIGYLPDTATSSDVLAIISFNKTGIIILNNG